MIKKFKLFESTVEIKSIEEYTMSNIIDLSKSSLGLREVYKYGEINDYKFTDYTIDAIIFLLKKVYNLDSYNNSLYNPVSSCKVITLNLEYSKNFDELVKNGDNYTFRVGFNNNKVLCIHVNKIFIYRFLSIPDPKYRSSLISKNKVEVVDPMGILVWDNGQWVNSKSSDYTQKFTDKPDSKTTTSEIKSILGKIKDKKKLL